MSVLKYEKQVP